jgi:hypothetical protein
VAQPDDGPEIAGPPSGIDIGIGIGIGVGIECGNATAPSSFRNVGLLPSNS